MFRVHSRPVSASEAKNGPPDRFRPSYCPLFAVGVKGFRYPCVDPHRNPDLLAAVGGPSPLSGQNQHPSLSFSTAYSVFHAKSRGPPFVNVIVFHVAVPFSAILPEARRLFLSKPPVRMSIAPARPLWYACATIGTNCYLSLPFSSNS